MISVMGRLNTECFSVPTIDMFEPDILDFELWLL